MNVPPPRSRVGAAVRRPGAVWLARWRHSWTHSLRFRLLALGLMPLLVAFPVVIAVLVLVGGERTDALLTGTLRSHLAGSLNHLEQTKSEARVRLTQLVRSQRLIDALRQGAPRHEIDPLLQTAAEGSGLDFLVAATADGRVIASSQPVAAGARLPDTYVVRQARLGVANAAYERVGLDEIGAFASAFQDVLRQHPASAAGAHPAGLLIGAAAHFPLTVGMPDTLLVGGVLLNHNLSLIEHMREIIFPVGTLPDGSEGLHTLFLGEQGVASSHPLHPEHRHLLAAPEVVAEVLQQGRPWLGVQTVDGHPYRIGYVPLADGDGRRIGMVSAGFPDAPYQHMALVLLGTVSGLLALTMLAISVLFLRTGREIANRLHKVEDTMNRVHHGERAARVAPSPLPDELGRLGQAFNDLLDTIDTQEAQQRAAQQMVELRTTELAAANAAKSEFLANMSHEIRTPMNAVLGLTQLLLDTELNAKQRDHLGKAHQAAAALLGILNDVLDYAKIEAGQLRVESVPLALDEVLTQSLDLFQARASEKGLRLRLHLPTEVPRQLEGDPLRLGQVLTNLVGNAVKFTERGGVDVAVTCLDPHADPVQLRVSVQDSGIGMTAEQAERVFDAFIQADASTTRRYGGTGLGLSICKRLVGLMGGQIGVHSSPGQGSTFWFTVALRRGTASATAHAPRPRRGQGLAELARLTRPIHGALVLLVDDNATNLLVAQEFLEKMGLHVQTADSGRAAVDAVARGAFDAVLMDLHMNDMDGFAAARAVRALPHGRQLPIIALSAAALPRDVADSHAAGMDDHLAKPIVPRALAECLLRWIPPHTLPPSGPDTLSPTDDPAHRPFTVPGLDLDSAVQGLDHDWDALRRVLRSFHRDTLHAPAQLTQALAQHAWPEAHRIAHTVKGLAPLIGATPLHRAAEALEQALTEQRTEPAPGFIALLQQTLDRLAPLATDTPVPRPEVDRPTPPVETLTTELQQLDEWLASGNSRAFALNRQLTAALQGTALQAPYALVDRAIARFDFKTARQYLQPLRPDAA
ncbi:ATP-binding protein [Macromonas nakdongensis]|uniref:ATP-binding protein n=1 Tax=Macromonas nakdongensis TaxID=1843082 RepID=UPI0012FF57E1|nr:ATP-binding protein [Macromonas nakdongensis]